MKRFMHPTKNLLMGGVIVPAGEWFQWDHDFIPSGCVEVLPQQTVEPVEIVVPKDVAPAELFAPVDAAFPVTPVVAMSKRKKI